MPSPPEDVDDDAAYEKASRRWRTKIEIWNIQTSEFDRRENNIRLVNEAIFNLIDPQLRKLMTEKKTPHERLAFLQERFGASYQEYFGEEHACPYDQILYERWVISEGFKGPRKGQNVIKWLDNWEDLRQEILRYDIEEDKSHPRRFLMATRDIIPEWWMAWYYKVLIKNEKISTTKLVADFRTAFIRLKGEITF